MKIKNHATCLFDANKWTMTHGGKLYCRRLSNRGKGSNCGDNGGKGSNGGGSTKVPWRLILKYLKISGTNSKQWGVGF